MIGGICMANKYTKLQFDRYEIGIMINALNELRNKQIREERPTDPVDELMIKLYYSQENIFSKLFRRNAYDCR